MKALRSTLRTLAGLLVMAAMLAPAARAQGTAEKTYKARCVACHAADGGGSDAGKKLGAHDFRAPEVQKMSDDDLSEAIGKGKNKMPGYAKTLKADEIKELVAYVRGLGKKT